MKIPVQDLSSRFDCQFIDRQLVVINLGEMPW